MNNDNIKIYQVYHDKNLINQNGILFEPYCTTDIHNDNEKCLNKYQHLLNEFVAQYYIYKNNKRSDIVGFCHYNKYFNIEQPFIYGDEIRYNVNPEILNISNLDNKIIAFQEFPSEYLFSNLLYYDNYIYNKLYNFIYNHYYQYFNRFININSSKKENFIRFEAFICTYDKFEEYMKFMLDLLKYLGLDLDNVNCEDDIINTLHNFTLHTYIDIHSKGMDKYPWYINNLQRRVAYFIEFACALYWYLTGYDIVYNYTSQQYI